MTRLYDRWELKLKGIPWSVFRLVTLVRECCVLSTAKISAAGYSAFRYEPSFNDRRFFFYLNVCWEKLYNYWDRIGDLLCLCFRLPIDPRPVFFSTVMSDLEKLFSSSANFRALKAFFDGEYQQVLNKARIKIVHYRQQDTDFFWQWLVNVTDGAAINNLQARRDAQPDILKKQSKLAIQGFGNAGRLIKEFN